MLLSPLHEAARRATEAPVAAGPGLIQPERTPAAVNQESPPQLTQHTASHPDRRSSSPLQQSAMAAVASGAPYAGTGSPMDAYSGAPAQQPYSMAIVARSPQFGALQVTDRKICR